MAATAGFLKELEAAAAALREKEQNRELTRASRQAEPETKEQAAAKRKEKTLLVKALTRMTVTLAEMGDIEGVKRAVASGAKLGSALDRGRTPLEAALGAGKTEMALWLADQPELHLPRYRSAAFHECAKCDAVEVFKKLDARFPELVKEFASGILESAYASPHAPRLARYLEEQAPRWGLSRSRGPGSAQPLLGAALAGNWETADFHLKKVLPRWLDTQGGQAHWVDEARGYRPTLSSLRSFLTALFAEDNAQALIYMLRSAPALMLQCAQLTGKDPLAGPAGHDSGLGFLNAQRFSLRVVGAQNEEFARRAERYMAGELAVPLVFIAAQQGARECLDILLAISAFGDLARKAQAEPESYLWEEGLFSAGSVEVYSALRKAGFDFSKALADGSNFLHITLLARSSKAMVERIGRDLSELIDQKNNAGRSPTAEMASRHAWRAPEAAKFEALLQKAAIKSVANAGSRKKAVRETAKPKRL